MANEEIIAIIMALGALAIVMLIILIPIWIIYIIGLWKMFKKAGKKGWEAIIPFYNNWVYVEVAGLNWWYFLFIISGTIVTFIDLDELSPLCNLVSFVAIFFCNYNIAKKLHKGTGFAVAMTLVGFIIIPLIGFSKEYVWDNDVLVSANGPIGDSNSSQNNNYSTVVNNNSYEHNQNSTNNQISSTKKYCTNCGNEITTDTKYCPNCGNEIK